MKEILTDIFGNKVEGDVNCEWLIDAEDSWKARNSEAEVGVPMQRIS